MRCAQRTGTAVALWVALAAAGAAPSQPMDFGHAKYEKLATREATEQRMLNILYNEGDLVWGPWKCIGPFAGSEKGMLSRPWPVEEELPRLTANGAGPDFLRTYPGKKGATARWVDIGMVDNAAINLGIFGSGDLANDTTAYLHRTITCAQPRTIKVQMGSDDGLRVWLNNELLVDADEPRGLDPEAHTVTLDLQPGVNHLLCKVTQGKGGWQYQITTRQPLTALIDAKLQYQLQQDFPSAEDEHYRQATIPIPDGIVLEVGGLDVLPDGRAAVCTRRGDVYIIDGVKDMPPLNPKFTRFASGLHEPLGLAVRVEEGKTVIYCAQRGELTRLVDTDGDDRADVYQTFSDAWGVSGNYHEFAFGPKFDSHGNAWVSLNVGFCDSLGKSIVPWRGWAVKITPGGDLIPVCDGLRSPNGIGFNREGVAFYVDNQGDFVGTCRMTALLPGSWAGHPASLRWREGWKEGDAPPERLMATIWFPYMKMGQSTADIARCEQDGMFGPFDGQLFCGDQMDGSVMRVDLEEVDGHWQGACFPFRGNLDCGVNRVCFDSTGNMLVGQTDRGWGSKGRRRYGVQRIVWTGRTPFEILSMRAAPDGFVLTFTKDVDKESVEAAASYSMQSYTYTYHARYGSPEVDSKPVRIVGGTLLGTRTVHLKCDGLRAGGEGYVHELFAGGVKDAEGRPLVHPQAYYTLQKKPSDMPKVTAK